MRHMNLVLASTPRSVADNRDVSSPTSAEHDDLCGDFLSNKCGNPEPCLRIRPPALLSVTSLTALPLQTALAQKHGPHPALCPHLVKASPGHLVHIHSLQSTSSTITLQLHKLFQGALWNSWSITVKIPCTVLIFSDHSLPSLALACRHHLPCSPPRLQCECSAPWPLHTLYHQLLRELSVIFAHLKFANHSSFFLPEKCQLRFLCHHTTPPLPSQLGSFINIWVILPCFLNILASSITITPSILS